VTFLIFHREHGLAADMAFIAMSDTIKGPFYDIERSGPVV
jgi:hypothetical protein